MNRLTTTRRLTIHISYTKSSSSLPLLCLSGKDINNFCTTGFHTSLIMFLSIYLLYYSYIIGCFEAFQLVYFLSTTLRSLACHPTSLYKSCTYESLEKSYLTPNTFRPSITTELQNHEPPLISRITQLHLEEVLFVLHLVFESLLYGLNFLETDPHAVKFSRSAAALLPLAALTQDKINSRRWTEEQPNTPDFFYDGPIKDVNKKPGEFPPGGVELSDAWVFAIVRKSSLSRSQDRATTQWTN